MIIRSVAVLGAGTMGAQIAAHFANAGIPVLLLDVTADAARHGLERARTLKPDPFFTPDTWKLITTAAFDPGMADVVRSDWILEAVVEQLDVKRALLEQIDAARRPGSIVTTNTSGLSIAELARGRSDDFRRHWLGTHFFNPPRYLHLLEIIPTAETLPDIVAGISQFADLRLGKGVVVAKDSPSFIGNHIGLYAFLRILPKVASGEYTIEEVDAITGPALGRPKSATFRTMDIAGLDILAHVVGNMRETIGGDAWTLPPFVTRMIETGAIGEKAGRGFYKRDRKAEGESEILTLDPATLDYRQRQPPRMPSLERTAGIGDMRERVRALYNADDKAGRFLRDTLGPTLDYTASIAASIAHSPADVDRVMRWGFGWELGPFELMETLGIGQPVDGLRDVTPGIEILRAAKERSRIVRRNAGASLVDLGDGVLCVEFHSKMNIIGADTIEMLQAGVRDASRSFQALVIGNEAPNFSAGANLMLVLLEAQNENWEEIDATIRAFQQANMAIRYADVPVIVAPSGLTLGGGCEIALHGDRIQAAAESYIGLVEVGVGLIPAAGGTKEMTVRASESMPPGSTDYLPPLQRVFETVGFGKVSSSAPDAGRLGYLQSTDAYTMNRERTLADAKARALQRVREGYQPPPPRNRIRVGGETVLAALKLGMHLLWRGGRITDYDVVIGRRLATVMAGGASLPHPAPVTEQELLDLEREAFLSLLGERKTQERIQHTLKTGKTLRN